MFETEAINAYGITKREPAQDVWYSHGVRVMGVGESECLRAKLSCNGMLVELDPLVHSAGNEQLLTDVINSAICALDFNLRRSWWEEGLDVRDAMDAYAPTLLLDEKSRHFSSELYEIMQKTRLRISDERSPVAVTINALPQITSIESIETDEYEGLQDLEWLMATVTEAIQRAFMLKRGYLALRTQRPFDQDVLGYDWIYSYIRKHFEQGLRPHCEYDDERMFVLLPLGDQSEALARTVLTKHFAEAKHAGKKLDIILGFNDGVDYPDLVRELSSDADVIDLYVNETESTGVDAKRYGLNSLNIHTDPWREGDPYIIPETDTPLHRVFAVRQEKQEDSKGKCRLQRIFGRMMLDQMIRGGKIPSKIRVADADAWFFDTSEFGPSESAPFLDTHCLSTLLREMEERDLKMISAKSWSSKFTNDRPDGKIPDLGQPVPAVYRLMDLAHGKYHNTVIGGATIHDFATGLAMILTITERYMSRAEDFHESLLATAAGVRFGVSESIHATNQVHDDLCEAKRWLEDATGLAQHYGRSQYPDVADVFRAVVNANGMKELAEQTDDPSQALADYSMLIRHGQKHPRDPRSKDPSWKTG